jgi:hypothetical protein
MKRLTLFVVGIASMSVASSMGCGGVDAASVAGDDGGVAETSMPGVDAGTADALVESGPPTDSQALDAAAVETGLSPAVRSGCESLCSSELDAGCSGQSSLSQCLIGCAVLLGNPNCVTQSSALLSCAQGAAMSCDSSGNVVISGCEVDQLQAESCALASAIDPTLNGPCTQYCATVAAAKCPNDDDAGCVPGCEMAGTLVAPCTPSWTGYVTCAESATMTCGSDGKASATACTGQFLEFVGCFAQGMSSLVGDGG